jgi:hypothetical protein
MGALLLVLVLMLGAAACGGSARVAPPNARPPGGSTGDASAGGGGAGVDGATASGGAAPIFVVAMENESAADIYGSASAPYINGVLLPSGASASNFVDVAPALASEPHYLLMEAGTNAFADHTFTTDDPPSAGNSTASADHLAAQIDSAGRGLDWVTYQEAIEPADACPVAGTGLYTPSHNPFVFFQDVAGAPPSQANAYCAAHHKPLDALDGDLAAGAIASYVFITPDLCHDMHGAPACAGGDLVRAGDDWLETVMPALVSYAGAHGGVVFVVWDQGGATDTLPFIALGPRVKAGYQSSVGFDHGSIVKTVELLLQLPVLPAAAASADLGDLFLPGTF